MTDAQILRQGRADFLAAIDPGNPNAAVITGVRPNSSDPLDVAAVTEQAKHVEARVKQAMRVAGTLPRSLDRFQR
jgi:hypothetical protein